MTKPDPNAGIDPSKRHEPADGNLPSRGELLGCLIAWILLFLVAGFIVWLALRP